MSRLQALRNTIQLLSFFLIQNLLTSMSTLANAGATVLSYVDSLGLLKVVAWLEDEFDIGVDDSELGPDSFRTVAAIKAYVDQARSAAHAE